MELNNNIQCPEKPLNSYLLHCRYLREQYLDVRYSSVQLSRLWKEADPNLKKMFQNQAKELGKIYSKAMEIYRSIQFTESLMTKNSNSEKYQSHIKLLKSYRDLNTLNVELNRNNSTSPTSWPINEPFFLDISSTEKQLDLIRFEHVNQNDILIPNTYPNLN
ncbi:hypothetical protein BC833DRAFT_564427 [Globomyces pollinis-pini]|nr:hypothetical protein BC833DRAFT_564427 [Globomyces pollinis-pini]